MKFPIVFLLIVLLVACAPQPETIPDPDTPVTSPPEDVQGADVSTNEPTLNAFAPQPGDQDLKRGNAYLNKVDLLIRESFPPQLSLVLKGDLPTPCNKLRVDVREPDAENKIVVDVYSVIDPDQICAQVIEPFEASLDLGTYPTGHYTVWVNEQMAGEFDT